MNHVIRKLRERRGLSQREAARQAGIRQATWSEIESGNANPRLSTLRAIAKVLKTQAWRLMK